MHRFYCLAYSPWSEKARWALDHHKIAHLSVPYTPLLGEVPLRMKTGRWSGKISVPVMKTEGPEGWLNDSWAIAQWAEKTGKGTPLFPAERKAEIEAWNGLSDEGLDAARAIGLERVLSNDAWLASLVPRKVRRILGPLAPVVSAFGVRRTLQKYGSRRRSLSEQNERLHKVLVSIREALAGKERETLLGTFSYADVAVAQVFQFVHPKILGGFKLGKSGLDGYRHPAFAEEFSDLVKWRDWVYENFRGQA